MIRTRSPAIAPLSSAYLTFPLFINFIAFSPISSADNPNRSPTTIRKSHGQHSASTVSDTEEPGLFRTVSLSVKIARRESENASCASLKFTPSSRCLPLPLLRPTRISPRPVGKNGAICQHGVGSHIYSRGVAFHSARRVGIWMSEILHRAGIEPAIKRLFHR